MIWDYIIEFCEVIDLLVQKSFGQFMPEIMASFSLSLLLYTVGSYLAKKNHPFWKYFLTIIFGIYAMYKIYIWQIVKTLDWKNALTTIFLVFLLVVYPLGLLLASTIFKDYRIMDVKVFNYWTFWIIYLAMAIIWELWDGKDISIEFCILYFIFSLVLVYCFGENDRIASK